MTIYSDLIEECRHHLMTAQPDRLNVLDTDITSSTDTLILRHENKGAAEGSRIAIGLEEMMVIAVQTTGATTTLTVARGMNGSLPAAHLADAHVYINPQFSNFRIGKYINQALLSLSAEQLFQIRNITLTSNVVKLGYDLAGTIDFIDVWRVKHDEVGVSNHWPVLRPDEYWVDNAANTTDFPSGKALILVRGVWTSRPITVSYRSGFTPLVNLADNVRTVSGLHSEAHDLPPMYAAIALLTGREVKRTFLHAQPEPRRQDEVPPGAMNQAMRPLLQRYSDRLDIEISRLKRMYPKAH